jgi:acetyl-CoA acetyltransferase
MGFETIPIINVENACCSSSTGLNQAFAAIKAGLCKVGLVVGAESDKACVEAFWDIELVVATDDRHGLRAHQTSMYACNGCGFG